MNAIHDLLPGGFIIASALPPETEELRVTATAGPGRIIGPATRIFGSGSGRAMVRRAVEAHAGR